MAKLIYLNNMIYRNVLHCLVINSMFQNIKIKWRNLVKLISLKFPFDCVNHCRLAEYMKNKLSSARII